MIEEYRQSLINAINACPLTLDVKYYIFKDVFRELQDTYFTALKNQKEKEVATDDNAENQAKSDTERDNAEV